MANTRPGNWRVSSKKDAMVKDVFRQPRQSVHNDRMTDKRMNNLIEWNDFYRKNIQIFVNHYFGIQLYPYQTLWLYDMSQADSYVAICSRAVGK